MAYLRLHSRTAAVRSRKLIHQELQMKYGQTPSSQNGLRFGMIRVTHLYVAHNTDRQLLALNFADYREHRHARSAISRKQELVTIDVTYSNWSYAI